MADIHFHIWLYKRDTDGIIRSMERAEEQFDTRRKANYGLEVFRRQRSLAGQVVQCVDGAFCKPPPDWVVKGYTLAGPREFKAEYFIEDTPSIRPSRKLFLGMESLERYANEHPEDVIQRPLDDREMREPEVTMASRSTNEPKKWPRDSCTGPGGGLYTGPGGGAYTGPGGGAYTGPGGGAYTGLGGGLSTGPGGGLSTGPGGGLSTGTGGGLSTGPGGGLSTGPGGGLYTGPGGGLYTGPGGRLTPTYRNNIPPRTVFLEQLLMRGYQAQYRKLKAAWGL